MEYLVQYSGESGEEWSKNEHIKLNHIYFRPVEYSVSNNVWVKKVF